MAHAVRLPMPCPVQLGSIRGDSLEARLHEYVRQGNYVKVKKLLEKGAFVDAVNSKGQTSLFTAALLGLGKIADVLLDYGSNADHRCYDGSTPVHAAAFSGNHWILSKLLDAGGDLRVHDKDGRNPQHWAMSAGQEGSAQVLEFIQRCTCHMQAAIQNFPSDLWRKVGSSKALVSSPSRFGGLVRGNVDSPLGRFLKDRANVAKNIYNFGFGKFYLAGSGHPGYLASLPIIGEKDVVQADDEPAFSYHVGPYMIMTNLVWGGSRVTVKELGFEPHQNCSKVRLADLLLAEQEQSSKLRHPRLLQLMSVCLSADLEKTRLVYERVNFGSLYSILHERRTEFPILHMEMILHVLLQINDALCFLHYRGFIHRSITSYAIQIVSSGEAKLCNLEYMIESKDGGEHSDLTRIPLPVQLYKWCSPEVILEKAVTVQSDIYSFCTVMQEALTETPPWIGHEDSVIKELIISGQQLEADVRLPEPYYGIVKSGLEPKQKNRSMKLQDIQYILKNDLKDLTKSQASRAMELSQAKGPAGLADVNMCLTSAFSCQKRTEELQGEEITQADSSSAPESSTEYSTEEEEWVSEASDLCVLAQVREDTGRRMSSLSRNEQHISKCVHDVNTMQRMLQQAADSLRRTEEKLDKLEASKKQKKLLQEVGVSQLSKQIFQDRHWNRSGDTSQNTNNPFSGANTLWKATGPPSSVYIPPLITCQAQGALGRARFQAVSKTAKEMEAIKNEKSKCFHEMSKIENESNHHDLSFREVKRLEDEMSLDHEHLLPRVSVRWKKNLNLQCQRGGDSHSAARGSEEEKWCYPKPRSEICSTKVNEERRMMQSDWRIEVKRMAKRVAWGQLELGSSYPINESPSESEAERAQEAFQHVTVRDQRSHDQQRRWQTGDYVEPLDLGNEETSVFEESGLDSAFRSSGGRSWESSSQDEQAESGIAFHRNSVLPQQVENLSRKHSRDLHCSINSSPEVSEKRLTSDADYVLPPPIAQGCSEPETLNAQGKLEDACEGFLQKQLPEDTGSGIQASGGRMLFCSTAAQNSGSNTGGVNQCSRMPVARVEVAQEVIQWEQQKESKEKDVSVTDIQDFSSIPYEQENYCRVVDCKTPRVSHAPTSISTPLSSEEKIPLAFERYKLCHDVPSNTSFCGSQEVSAVSQMFITAYEERSTEIPSVASGVHGSALNEPDGLAAVASSVSASSEASALSQESNYFIDELPPPAQELLDEIDYLNQQDSTAQDLEENGLYDCGVQINVPDQIKMKDSESKKESERNEKKNHNSWTKAPFNLAEETERAHSTLDGILEGMVATIPGGEEIQEQPQGHTLELAGLQACKIQKTLERRE